ncbi:DNA-binding transcriptional regulator, MocR family, contains an aminotransferase domain [Filimonas lacunae]|uniref:DNA-binding transcriptional regulator, MocR family, contains an aminotransferase domain n=1 Tax=Filimonas lacunae TaxID=477680 RepID=A0A173MQ64_9BACT|nr:PLP-dependent aminotransferase family protein [Filimonas lacunae]BAV09521.1 GntR family transcriptional regulator YdcR [Filimonas lacunae]SIS74578.1 DNA-binding transcriptional regulator, MocR family, contains an aminotransferase domain [Filimonas lacunae]
MATPITVQEDFLYLRIADRLQVQIEQQVLKTGDRLPSVRALSKEQGISITTAFQAYSELEIKGLIEARPKSGYYVRFTPSQFPRLMAKQHKERPKKVSVESITSLIYQKMRQEGVTKFSLAVPSIDLLPEAKLNKSMMEAIRKSPTSCLEYEDTQGNPSLRSQLARYTFNWGGQHTADDIVTTQGCMEALGFCLKAVTDPGDTVAIETPTYFGIFNVLQSLGLKALEVPVDPTTGLDIEYLEKALDTVKIKACLFVTSFNNPTGCDMPVERKKQLVTLLSDRDIPLIEDDIYGEMYFGKTRPLPCKAFDTKGIVLLCSSISKTLAPGYRVGWCIPGKFLDKVIHLKLMHIVSSATPTQAAIAHFLETGRYDLHMRNLRKALHTQCLLYTQAIARFFPPDTKVSRPAGGFVLWIEMNEAVNTMELFHEALDHGISIAPGQLFNADGRFNHHIRISFGSTYNTTIEKSLQTLGRLVKNKQA